MVNTTGVATIDYGKLKDFIAEEGDDRELFQKIVNAPFICNPPEVAFLFLGIMVFLLVNKETGTIDRVALSNTELAKNTTDVSYVPFEEIKIPVDYTDNILAKAIATGEPQDTTDWKYLFAPALNAEQARINQASGGIAYSAVYPLPGVKDGAAMIFSYYQYLHGIGEAQHEFMNKYISVVTERLKTA